MVHRLHSTSHNHRRHDEGAGGCPRFDVTGLARQVPSTHGGGQTDGEDAVLQLAPFSHGVMARAGVNSPTSRASKPLHLTALYASLEPSTSRPPPPPPDQRCAALPLPSVQLRTRFAEFRTSTQCTQYLAGLYPEQDCPTLCHAPDSSRHMPAHSTQPFARLPVAHA